MRLLRCKSNDDFELATFTDKIPPYVSVSHPWTDNKVINNELVASNGKDKAGYTKIRFYGEKAAYDSLEYF
jgi:hypothetical protein